MSGTLQPIVWLGIGVGWWSLLLVGAAVTFYRSKRRSRGGRGKRRNLALYLILVALALVAAWFWPLGRDWLVIPMFTVALGLMSPLFIPLALLAPGFALIWWVQRKIARRWPVPATSAAHTKSGASDPVAAKRSKLRPRNLALAWLGATIVIAAILFVATSSAPIHFSLDVFGKSYASEPSAPTEARPFFGSVLIIAAGLVSALLVSLGHVGLRMVRGRGAPR